MYDYPKKREREREREREGLLSTASCSVMATMSDV
jgi:hypothetical protein